MPKIIFLAWILTIPCFSSATELTPNDVYHKASQIYQEVLNIKKHLGITQVAQESPVATQLTPKHIWQKSYEILYKINVLRKKLKLPLLSIPSHEPLLTMSPLISYEQMTRIITELEILKYHLNISEAVADIPAIAGDKTSTDVYRLMNKVSYELDAISGRTLTPADVLTQAVRISEDVNVILNILRIKNDTIPPKKNPKALPGDSFENVSQLLGEITRLNKMIGMDNIDFNAFIPANRAITPSDVFSIAGIALAELQPIKAYLGLTYILTPMAEHYENIRPAEVQQLFGWNIRKLQLVQKIKRNNS